LTAAVPRLQDAGAATLSIPGSLSMPLRFTLRQLEYFVAVAEHGSIAAASGQINVSSPSISAAISQLEEVFRLALFTRKHAHALTLTRAGGQFLAQARQVIREANRLGTLASDITGKVGGPLNVGCLLTFAQIVLPELRRRFCDSYPDVDFRQFERPQTELIEGIERAAFDVALTYDLNIPVKLQFVGLVELKPYALLPESHPLARARSLTLAQLADYPMVLLDLPFSSTYFLSLFEKSKVAPRIVERSRDMAVVQSLVANGFGYALANIRPTTDRAPDGKTLRFVPVSGPLRPMRMGLLLSDTAKSSLAVRKFVEHCRDSVRRGEVPGLKMPG
jgi:DNA-binding transcriptional LysR family regulator